ncbi:MAG: AtpZ/AtpI family protein [Chloroflexi bacterium]|nr:AtpZ/AtpI family protein [Chloroflexota bacterium]
MNTRGKGTVFRLLGIGWFVALCIGGGTVGGRLLDRQLDLDFPVFTLLGLGVGIALAFVGMFRMLMAVLAEDTDSRGEEKG